MKDLNREWARSRIEAAADGSLSSSEEARFREAAAADASLARELARAERLNAELAGLRRSPVPAGLLRSLLGIPRSARGSRRPPARRWLLTGATAAAAVAAVGVTLLKRPVPTSPPLDERAQAVADFELAMSYLKQSTEIAQSEVTGVLGNALHRALAGHGDAAPDQRSQTDTGD